MEASFVDRLLKRILVSVPRARAWLEAHRATALEVQRLRSAVVHLEEQLAKVEKASGIVPQPKASGIGAALSRRRTPGYEFLSAERIPTYRAKRAKTKYGGCFMCNGIFVKADKHLGCSCQIGYYSSLGDISKIDVGQFVTGPLIKYIRESFKKGYEPFEICRYCVSRTSEYPALADPANPASSDENAITIHVEPSNMCNLWCEVCTCTDERKSENTPKRVQLEYGAFEKLITEVKRAGVSVKVLALVGFGEPLFNSDLPRMAQVTRTAYPECFIYLDTNGNFGPKRAEEIANCGIDQIRLGIDGVDQATYEGYRKKGDFDKAIAFTRQLVASIRKHGSPTRPIWKYILFNHNDRDEHILEAMRMTSEIGIEIDFDLTAGALASERTIEDIRALVGSKKIGMNLDPEFMAVNYEATA